MWKKNYLSISLPYIKIPEKMTSFVILIWKTKIKWLKMTRNPSLYEEFGSFCNQLFWNWYKNKAGNAKITWRTKSVLISFCTVCLVTHFTILIFMYKIKYSSCIIWCVHKQYVFIYFRYIQIYLLDVYYYPFFIKTRMKNIK